MRKIYRHKDNRAYWDERWESSGVDREGFVNRDIYPIKYADMALELTKIASGGGATLRLLEAGCGAGRVYFDYWNRGYDITGLERSGAAVRQVLALYPEAKVYEGEIENLPFEDESFDLMYAFGLYHNLETKEAVVRAFDESYRVLCKPRAQKKGGILLFSVRIDSLENRLIESIMANRTQGIADKFHRMHFDRSDIEELLGNRFEILHYFYVRNVSFLFKFNLFRSPAMKRDRFSEAKARSEGFELNLVGRWIDKFLHSMFPWCFSNLVVVCARVRS